MFLLRTDNQLKTQTRCQVKSTNCSHISDNMQSRTITKTFGNTNEVCEGIDVQNFNEIINN